MTSRRILLLTLDLPPDQDGGIGALIDALARGLVALGHEGRVVTRGRRGDGADRPEPERPYPVVRLPGRSWRRWGDVWWAAALPGVLRGERPDAIVAATWETARVASRLGPRLGVPVAVLASGRDVTGVLPPARDRLRREVLCRCDRVFALSRWMEGVLRGIGVPADRIVPFEPGIVLPAATSDPGDAPPTALCLGRLIPRKGQDRLIAAWPEVRTRVPDARLLLVGRGPDEARLRALAREEGVPGGVEFAGFLEGDALEAAWARARIYAMPCREEADGDTEGYGLTFLEAGARGLPVVGGRTGGVPEAIDDGVTGLLVDPDDPPGLVVAVAGLLADPDRARALGRAGRARVLARHSPEGFAAGVCGGLEGA